MKTTFKHNRYLFIILFSAIVLGFSCSQHSNIKHLTTKKEIQNSYPIATTTQLSDSSTGRQHPACCKGVPSRSKIVTEKK